MSYLKKIKIFTIIIHSFIIIGVGHGIGIMGIIDIASIPNLIDGYGFTLKGEFSDKIMSIGLISLIGKVLLIISLFLKSKLNKRIFEIVGILFLWVSVYFLTSGNWSYNWLYGFTFLTSVPFLIASIKLISLMLKNKSKIKN
jgi:hypothetical protein